MQVVDYYDSVSLLYRAARVEQLEPICSKILGNIGVRFYRYEWHDAPNGGTDGTIRIAACPSRWLAHYSAQNYFAIDPKFEYAMNAVVPMLWGPEMCDAPAPEAVRRFWRDTSDFGLGYGVTFPIRSRTGGKAMFCAAMAADHADRMETLAHLPFMESLAFHLHDAIEQMTLRRSARANALTSREREVVKWTAAGKTAREVGALLGISQATVLYHLNNAKRKLSVANKYQLTARATALDLI